MFAPALPWHRQLLRRTGILWPLKAFGTMGFMVLFFWAYFEILRNPPSPPTVMPLLALDHWIPFTPLAFPAYVSLWVYVSLPPALLGHFRALAWFGVWISALCLACLGIFWLWPTAVPPAGIDWTQYPELAFMKSIDAAGNACPSLHVASAVFSMAWMARVFRQVRAPVWLHGLSSLICLAILWSTVATRQHVVLDVLAGAVVGALFARVSLRHVARQVGDRGF